MIEDAVRDGADTLQAVMDATGAGRGCGKSAIPLAACRCAVPW